jgi:hypothetical protein
MRAATTGGRRCVTADAEDHARAQLRQDRERPPDAAGQAADAEHRTSHPAAAELPTGQQVDGEAAPGTTRASMPFAVPRNSTRHPRARSASATASPG